MFERAHHRSGGPSKIKWAKSDYFSFLVGVHSTRGPFNGSFHPCRQSSGCATAAQAIHVAEDLFKQYFFLEMSTMTASEGPA